MKKRDLSIITGVTLALTVGVVALIIWNNQTPKAEVTVGKELPPPTEQVMEEPEPELQPPTEQVMEEPEPEPEPEPIENPEPEPNKLEEIRRKEKKQAEERVIAYKASRAQPVTPTVHPTQYLAKGAPLVVEVTSYDLSVQSCGKRPGESGYGITAGGDNLVGHTWDSARVIATDPTVIPTGSKVKLEFKDEDYRQFNGVYKASDTGSAIKGNIVDLFRGDFNSEQPHPDVKAFGRVQAKATIVE